LPRFDRLSFAVWAAGSSELTLAEPVEIKGKELANFTQVNNLFAPGLKPSVCSRRLCDLFA
jgi:hypothetical protein